MNYRNFCQFILTFSQDWRIKDLFAGEPPFAVTLGKPTMNSLLHVLLSALSGALALFTALAATAGLTSAGRRGNGRRHAIPRRRGGS